MTVGSPLTPRMTSLKRSRGQNWLVSFLTLVIWANVISDARGTATPEFIRTYFVEPIPNVTSSVGREVTLQCTVRNLDNHKVAWIKVDSQTLLTIHTRVIIRDPRIKISHNNFKQWFLHIQKVQSDDRGFYMCQMNTEPMVSQQGFLDVMVPPSFVDEETSSDVMVEEMARVSLKCEAKGYPTPTISWRREDGKEINSGSLSGRRKLVKTVEGEYLNISQATREDMGAYLCIASNGIPPSVSKRIILQVNFRPKIRVPNQLVGAALQTDVTLECILEASPRPLTSWIRSDGALLLNSKKFHLTETEDSYKIIMRLCINDLTSRDFGSYKCVGKNLLGEKEGYIRLYEVGSLRNGSKMEYVPLVEETQGPILDKGRRQTNVPVEVNINSDTANPVPRSTVSDSAASSSHYVSFIYVMLGILIIVPN